MIAYSVLEPAATSDDIVERIDRVTFVREGFAVLALVFPMIWLLFHRMWLVLFAFILVAATVNIGFVMLGLSETIAGWVTLAITLLFALNANDLRRWTLERRGFQFVGVVSGRNRDECEIRFFDNWEGAEAQNGENAMEPKSTLGDETGISTSS